MEYQQMALALDMSQYFLIFEISNKITVVGAWPWPEQLSVGGWPWPEQLSVDAWPEHLGWP
jgi:hypothetical protein